MEAVVTDHVLPNYSLGRASSGIAFLKAHSIDEAIKA